MVKGVNRILKRHNKKRENIYIPICGDIEEVLEQTADVKLFRIRTDSPVDYKPGQFFMVSVWGAGEVPISVASLNEDDNMLELCIRRAGAVTAAIHSLGRADTVWLRGPYGNSFPLELSSQRDVLVVAGGMGIAPLRPLIQWFIGHPAGAGRVTLLYGSRTPMDIVFENETERWKEGGIKAVITVDRAHHDWKGYTGIVTSLWHDVNADFKESTAFICGPEVMIKAVMKDLSSFGMADERMITTLEAHMKCGIGKCGHCYAGPKYICTDGPVFSSREIREYALLP